MIQYQSKLSYLAQQKLKAMSYYISFTNNYEELRKLIKRARPPFVPCLNLICKDFTYIDYTEEDQLEDSANMLLNVYKLE